MDQKELSKKIRRELFMWWLEEKLPLLRYIAVVTVLFGVLMLLSWLILLLVGVPAANVPN